MIEEYTEICMVESNQAYRISIDKYEFIRDIFMAGKPFVEVETIDGAITTIKLSRVESIGRFSSTALKCYNERKKESSFE
jgi:hypothetical protein